jgi:exopolysaccharide biosynthesis polyprenyl glycosylphosphotransferase
MPRIRTLFLLLGDILVLFASYVGSFLLLREAFWIPYSELFDFFTIENGFLRISFVIFSLIVCNYWFGLYDSLRAPGKRVLLETLTLVWGIVFILQALSSYVKSDLILSRWIMLFGSALSLINLVFWRNLYSFFLVSFVGRQRVLFLGDSPINREIAQHIEAHPEKGFQSLGCIQFEDEAASPMPPFPGGTVLTMHPDLGIESFNEAITVQRPERVVVGRQLPEDNILFQSLLQLSIQSVRIETAGELYEILYQQVPLDSLSVNQLIFSNDFRPSRLRLFLQACYSWLIALIGVLLSWPVMIATALAVKLDSEGPALLRQRRVGKNGRVFEILKFRSMYVDADKRFGRTRASEGDPRITRVGRVIRKWRLDELPQFFNVLRGDMNIVGPRPEMPEYVVELNRAIPLYPQRHRIKPGITGWAQLFHQTEFTIDDTRRKIQYDLYYIKNLSPALDFLIMFHTIRTIVLRVGAN